MAKLNQSKIKSVADGVAVEKNVAVESFETNEGDLDLREEEHRQHSTLRIYNTYLLEYYSVNSALTN